MRTRPLHLGAFAALIPLAGCVNMSGLSGGSKYACAAPDGVACESVSGTYVNALHENLPSQRASATAPGEPSTSRAKARAPDAVPAAAAPPRQPFAAAAPAIDAAGGVPGMALRSEARVLRLWTKPWEDADGDLWDQGFVYVQVDAGRWQIDHVRQRIRDQYAPLRPPPAVPATPSGTTEPGAGPIPAEAGPAGGAQSALQRPAPFKFFPLLRPPPAGTGPRPQ